MRYRYLVLIAVVLFVAALAFASAPGIGQKTAAPAASGQAPGTGVIGMPTLQVSGNGASMPAATSTAAEKPVSGPATAPQGVMPSVAAPSLVPGEVAGRAAPTGMATVKASPTMSPTSKATAKATVKPTAAATMKATPAPTGKAVTGGERAGDRVRGGGVSGGGFVINVVDYGIITTTISPGGVIRGYVVIQNNGNDVINDAIVHIVVTQASAAGVTVTTQDQPLSNLNIAPDDQRRVEFAVGVPASISPGSYDVRATVEANGQQLQSFTNTVTVS